MAKLPIPAALADKVSGLAGKLPFLPKKPSRPGGIDEPFESLEDASPGSDESFEPNALSGPSKREALSIDFGALVKAFFGNRILVGSLAALLLVLLAMSLVALFAQLEPRALPVSTPLVTEEGRALARHFLLPPDPARDLSPPMARETKLPYTDEDMKRLAPEHDPASLARLVEANDRDLSLLFGTAK